MTTSLKQIIPLSLALFVLLAYHFMGASTWTDAPASPPSNNALPPIHTGGNQIKNGALSVDGLSVYGRGHVESAAPTIEYSETNARDWWTRANNNRFYFIVDRDDDGSWSGEDPWPLFFQSGTSPSDDYASFSNQVRATEYCDRSGNNCITPSSGGDLGTVYSCPNIGTHMRCSTGCVGQLSSNNNCWYERYECTSHCGSSDGEVMGCRRYTGSCSAL